MSVLFASSLVSPGEDAVPKGHSPGGIIIPESCPEGFLWSWNQSGLGREYLCASLLLCLTCLFAEY